MHMHMNKHITMCELRMKRHIRLNISTSRPSLTRFVGEKRNRPAGITPTSTGSTVEYRIVLDLFFSTARYLIQKFDPTVSGTGQLNIITERNGAYRATLAYMQRASKDTDINHQVVKTSFKVTLILSVDLASFLYISWAFLDDLL
jgi:hypothetical protein